MTLTVKEGQELRKVVRETGKVFGLGSQQRSSPEFQHAVKLVQSGALGKITLVNAYVGAPPAPYNLPEEPLPADPDVPYETKIPHQINFIEAVRSRQDPVVPVEIGHSSCTVCTLGNIACELKRTIKWDPATETIVDDTDGTAAKLMHYEYRKPWKLV